jgi:hypothetical protein
MQENVLDGFQVRLAVYANQVVQARARPAGAGVKNVPPHEMPLDTNRLRCRAGGALAPASSGVFRFSAEQLEGVR